jgi:hypothetical protein
MKSQARSRRRRSTAELAGVASLVRLLPSHLFIVDLSHSFDTIGILRRFIRSEPNDSREP